MQKETAKAIIEVMRDVSGRMNNSIFLVMEGADADEIHRYKHAIGRAMGEIFLEIISPIVDEYPDLTPVELQSPLMPPGTYDPRES